MKKWIGALIALVLVVVGFFVFKSRTVPDSSDSLTPFSLELVGGEEVTSWNLKGAYTGNTELEKKAFAEVERLTGLLGTGEYEDYILYISIANQYHLLGDAKNELEYLKKALAIDSATTGLAWHNAGQLFAQLGAYQTARMALERAVAAQPIAQYQQALADLIAAHFPEDSVAK